MRLKNEYANFKKVNGKQKCSNQVTCEETVKSANNSNCKLTNLENKNNRHKIGSKEPGESNQMTSKRMVNRLNNSNFKLPNLPNDNNSNEKEPDYEEFKDEKDVKKWADGLYKKWYENLKQMQTQFYTKKHFEFTGSTFLNVNHTAVSIYKGSGYENMNSVLRGVKNINNESEYKWLCLKLIFEMLLAPRLDQDIVVYRFVDRETFNLIKNEINKGNAYVEEGFLSTTLLKDKINKEYEPYNDHNYILKIYVKKGNVAVYSSIFDENTDGKSEYEMIFLNNGILTKKNDYSSSENILELFYDNNIK